MNDLEVVGFSPQQANALADTSMRIAKEVVAPLEQRIIREAETARAEAKEARAEAKAEAETTRAEAKVEAETTRAEAKAEAKAARDIMFILAGSGVLTMIANTAVIKWL